MSRRVARWEPGERVPAESRNTRYLDLLAGRARLVVGIDDEPAVVRAAAALCSHAPFDERVAAVGV